MEKAGLSPGFLFVQIQGCLEKAFNLTEFIQENLL
jgi:hypothetical protein